MASQKNFLESFVSVRMHQGVSELIVGGGRAV